MPSLLTIAHDSRRAASNDEVRQLADPVRSQAGKAYADVETAFLELAEPSMSEGLAAHLGASATLPQGILGMAA